MLYILCIFWLFCFLLYVAFSGAEGGHIGAGLPDKEREEKTEEVEQTRSRERNPEKIRLGLAPPLEPKGRRVSSYV